MLNRIKFETLICSLVIQGLLVFTSISNLNGQEVCPFVAFPDGAIEFRVLLPAVNPPDFTAALLATFDLQSDGNVSGGSDWLYSLGFLIADPDKTFETTIIGGQLIGYYTRENNKNTHVQVTNHGGSNVEVHLWIFDENCTPLCDFCDSYTPKDTHVYNLSDVRRNADNTTIGICNTSLHNKEGFVIITPVDNCLSTDRAIAYPQFQGDSRIIDTANNFDYGAKLWARDVDTLFDCDDAIPDTPGGHKVLTGVDDCKFRDVLPSRLAQVYSTLPGSIAARSDLVFVSFQDDYGDPALPGYRPMPALSTFQVRLCDEDENCVSCATITACFARHGINEAIPNSDEPLPPPPVAPPGPPPAPPPAGPPVEPPGGGGSPFDPPGPPSSPPRGR